MNTLASISAVLFTVAASLVTVVLSVATLMGAALFTLASRIVIVLLTRSTRLLTLTVALALLVSAATFLIHLLIQRLPVRKSQASLKSRYPHAQLAVITGGASGLGRVISHRLMREGISVVVVGLPGPLIDFATWFYPKRGITAKIKFVRRDLGSESGTAKVLQKIDEEIGSDAVVHMLFNNAGYMLAGFFDGMPLDRALANYHCNATASVQLTHWFLNRHSDGGRRLIVFSSSPASMVPSPFAALYGATKAFLTSFATSLSVELHCRGTDVVLVHPSPFESNFYDHRQLLTFVYSLSRRPYKPEQVVDSIWNAAGRCTWVDQG